MPDITIKVPAVDKLLDYTASGVGAIAGPFLAPWRASREGKARLIAARADAEIQRLQATADSEALPIIAKARAEAQQYLVSPDTEVHGEVNITREDIIQRIEFQERKRLANIKSVVDYAADELGDKEVLDHEPDPDWTARFFNEVQDVSSEDMQKIWAKILAGEVESPGRTSLRTLDTLRNMTKRDAEMFRDICEFVISDAFVFYNNLVESIEAFKYNNLLHLQDCGLVNPGPGLQRVVTWPESREIAFMYQDSALSMAVKPDGKDELGIPAIPLTTAGTELSRLVQGTPQMEYLQALAKFLKSEKCQLYFLESVSQLPDGSIRYSQRTLIEPNSEQSSEATP